jgi:hypothetical protein
MNKLIVSKLSSAHGSHYYIYAKLPIWMSRQSHLLIIEWKKKLEKKKWGLNVPWREEPQVNGYELSTFQQSSSTNQDNKMQTNLHLNN